LPTRNFPTDRPASRIPLQSPAIGHVNGVSHGTEDTPPKDNTAEERGRCAWLRADDPYHMSADGWTGNLGNRTNAAVFEALLFHANRKTGIAYPSLTKIGKLCYGLSPRVVTRSLRELERIGAITLVSLGSGRNPSQYRINPPTVRHEVPLNCSR
jgi:hypothetical protein